MPDPDLDASSLDALQGSIEQWESRIAEATGHQAFQGHGNYYVSAAAKMGLRLTVEPAKIKCGCGAVTGQACWGDALPADQVVVIEYMPRELRASHEAAGNSGEWPHNGAVRIAVAKSCADAIMDPDPDDESDDADWTEIVYGANPYDYAEELG